MRSGSRVLIVAVGGALTASFLLSAPVALRAQFPGRPGKLAFARSASAGAAADIFVANADGSGLAKITAESGNYRAIDWSANGRKLAFEKVVGATTEIWVMNADGSEPRRASPEGASRFNPSWAPDNRYLAVDDGGSIYRIDTKTGHEVVLKKPGTIEGECLDNPYELPVFYSQPSWSPEGARIALILAHEFAPVPVGNTCDFNPNIKFDLGMIAAGGGPVTVLVDDPENASERFDGLPDWSPDGTKIAFMRGNASTTFGIAVVSSAGGTPTVLANGFGARPRWSPDGTHLLITRDQNGDGKSELWTIDSATGAMRTAVVQDTSHNLYQDWQPLPPALDVRLKAFAPDGTELEGRIALAQTITVKLQLRNTSDLALHDFEFAHGLPLVIDDRSVGGLELVSEEEVPADLTLEPFAKRTFKFEVRTTAVGRAALHTKAKAKDEDGVESEDPHSLKFEIADGAQLTDDLARWAMINAFGAFLQKGFGEWYDGMAGRGLALASRLREVMSPEQQLLWFGSLAGLPLAPADFAYGMLRGVAPEMAAALLPKNDYMGYSARDLDAVYNEAFREEVGHGVSEWAQNWVNLGGTVQKGLRDSWSEAMLTSFVLFGTATPEEQLQYASYQTALLDGIDSSTSNVFHTVKNELANAQANLEYFDQALDDSVADVFLLSPDIQNQMAAESEWRQNVIDLAATDPVGFQRAWAQRDAEIFNLGIPLIFDTLIGGGIFKTGGALGNVVIEGKGAAILRSGQAAGVIDEGGQVVKGAKSTIKPSTSNRPHGPGAAEIAEVERTGGYLDNVEGATIVQSSDLGNVYELPNLGGVPEITLDAKAAILGELESELFDATGQQLKLAEVLKTSSPLRKPKGVAKVELVPQKTGKPGMLDGGAPKDVLAEASVWQSSTHPSELPGWDGLSNLRQKAALKEWELANKRWAEWHAPEPGSKTAKLKECLGKKGRVPLDDQPNAAGLQRFVEAEFEEISVTEGNAQAKLIRVKEYRIEVVRAKDGKVLNSRTVVNRSEEALPLTPDADGVALGKVVGTDELGRPIVAPLSRAEREFLMQRYIDKNIKARKLKPGTPGAMPDAAEHGVTLVMDDASAKAAGKLLANYGIPFLPRLVGKSFLKRISPFVAKAGSTPEQILETYRQLLAAVESEGGFGQHAVLVTSDSRYLGEIPFASW